MCDLAMLTRKQCWRKTKPKIISTSQLARRVEKEFERKQGLLKNCSFEDIKYSTISSEENVQKLEIYASGGVPIVGERKRLRFSSTVYVLLIPSRHEISPYSSNLYWTEGNYQSFKKEAVDEIRSYIQTKKCTAKEAIQQLYQPFVLNNESKSLDESVVKSNKENDSSAAQKDGGNSVISIDEIKTQTLDTDTKNSFSPEAVHVLPTFEVQGIVGLEEEDAIHFLSAVKTDVELNKDLLKAEIAQAHSLGIHSIDPGDGVHGHHVIPHRTPSRSSTNGNMWAVQWRKGAEVH